MEGLTKHEHSSNEFSQTFLNEMYGTLQLAEEHVTSPRHDPKVQPQLRQRSTNRPSADGLCTLTCVFFLSLLCLPPMPPSYTSPASSADCSQ